MTEQNEIITPVFKNKPSNLQKHSFTARPAVKINVNEVELTIFKGTNVSSPYPHVQPSKTQSPILKAILAQEAFSMEGKHDIVAPIFKTKNSVVNKEEFIPRSAAK